MSNPLHDDPGLDHPSFWDLPPTTAVLADHLLAEHAALHATDEALALAVQARAAALGRERAARAAMAARMGDEGLTRVDRPRGSTAGIGVRTREGAGGEHEVIALPCLRVLPRRPVEDPLFVLRVAEEDAPASERRRRTA